MEWFLTLLLLAPVAAAGIYLKSKEPANANSKAALSLRDTLGLIALAVVVIGWSIYFARVGF